MGKKGGSSAPPPDPRLVEAQLKSIGIQDDMIRRVVEQSERMLPLQMEEMRFGLDTARTAHGQAQDDRRFALARRDELVTAQRPLLEMANKFDEQGRRGEMMSQANADISDAFDVTRRTQSRALERRGVTPNSGKYLSANTQVNIGEALARAAAGRKVSEAARAEGINLRTNAVNMLSGYPAMASGLSGTGFQFGTAGLGLANQGLAGTTSGFGSAAGISGQMGANAGGMYSTQVQARTAADNAKASGTGALIGGAATVAAAFI